MEEVGESGVCVQEKSADSGRPCIFCRREVPCECMSYVRDGGPLFDHVTGTFGWSNYPERCMCTCGGC